VLDDFTVRTHDLSYALQHAALESSELLFTSTTIFLFAWLLEKISCASMDFLDTGGKHVRLIIILTFSFKLPLVEFCIESFFGQTFCNNLLSVHQRERNLVKFQHVDNTGVKSTSRFDR
jgi:hypothetical protein